MEKITQADIEELMSLSFPTRVQSVIRKLLIQHLRNDLTQQFEIYMESSGEYTYEETTFFESLGVFLRTGEMYTSHRKYIVYVPEISQEEDFVSTYLSHAETFIETYLSKKAVSLIYYDGEYPSAQAYKEVISTLSEKYPGLVELVPPNFKVDLADLRNAHFKEVVDLSLANGYTPIDATSLVDHLKENLNGINSYGETISALDRKIVELKGNEKKPLFYYYDPERLNDTLISQIAVYVYHTYGVLSYHYSNFSQDRFRHEFTTGLFDLTNNSLHNVITNLKSLPDIAFYRRDHSYSSFVTMLLKEELEIPAVIKYIRYDNSGLDDVLEVEEIDLAKVELFNILDHYGVKSNSILYTDTYSTFRQDLSVLQRLLQPTEIINFRNTLLFYYKGTLCLGYVSNFSVSQGAILVAADNSLPPTQIKFDKDLVTQLLPLDWVLNFKDIGTKVKALLDLYQIRYGKGKKPNLKFKYTGDIKYCFLSSVPYPGYFLSSVEDFEGWSRFSPLARQYRNSFYPMFSRYIDMRILREKKDLFNYFLSSQESKPVVYLTPEMIKG